MQNMRATFFPGRASKLQGKYVYKASMLGKGSKQQEKCIGWHVGKVGRSW